MHFALLVLADGSKTLDEILAPYRETCLGGSPYAVFEDIEDEWRKTYETDMVRMAIVDGKPVGTAEFTAKLYDRNLVNIDVPYKELYDTFEDFMLGQTNENRDEIANRYGHWSNPNGKWMWYIVGGRWTGMLKANIGGHGERNTYSFDSRPNRYPIYRDGYFDIARVPDIENPDEIATHDVITPDGMWHSCGPYDPEIQNRRRADGWDETFAERFIDPYRDCLAIVVDYHT